MGHVEKMHPGALPNCISLIGSLERGDDGHHWSLALGRGFRSGYERSVAESLVLDAGLSVEYEPHWVRLSSGRKYAPDFYLPDRGVWLEVKGEWRGSGRKKFDEALTLLGKDRMILVGANCRKFFGRSGSL